MKTLMKPKVWATWKWSPDALARLEAVAQVVTAGDLTSLPGAEAVLISKEWANSEFMDLAGPTLKVLARPGIGLDNIDLPAATERGILVVNTPDAPTESTAEHAVALLLAVAKRVVMGDMALRGADIPRAHLQGTEVRDRILGVVGYGRIGRRVAEICALGLRMRVLAYDPFLAGPQPTPAGVEMVTDLEVLLSQADFVTLHTPLTPETYHLIGERELQLMKPGSYLINASRGRVVHEAALIRALAAGHLAGAGLDVFDPEPPAPDNPLLGMTQVVVTPHIASGTDRGLSAMIHGAIDQVLQVLRGERPPFLVNPEAWPGRVKRGVISDQSSVISHQLSV
jgi:D-3-phosphoglycerate dehydrogenase